MLYVRGEVNYYTIGQLQESVQGLSGKKEKMNRNSVLEELAS